MDKVTLYSTHCPQCSVLEKKLKEKKICFEVVTDDEILLKKEIKSIPQLEVDGFLMDFSSAINWINKLGEAKYEH